MSFKGKHAPVTGSSRGLLCSAEAGWITGQVLHADGGASLVDTFLPLEIQRG